VLAIARGDKAITAPAASETIEAGDLLAVAGTREAIEAAKGLLAP
jgi:CPA2 family monovalent cation:H+ antiporter-2